MCDEFGTPGYGCVPAGCPVADWGHNVSLASADGANAAEVSRANSGDNDLDWSLGLQLGLPTDGGLPIPELTLALTIPEGATTLSVTKFGGDDMVADLQAGVPFIAVSAARAGAPPTEGSVDLTFGDGCDSLRVVWNLSDGAGTSREGDVTLTRSPCEPCE